jgi:hypothetical protein
LLELVRIDGNKQGWTEKRQDAIDLICGEILIQRKYLKEDQTNEGDLKFIRGYNGL